MLHYIVISNNIQDFFQDQEMTIRRLFWKKIEKYVGISGMFDTEEDGLSLRSRLTLYVF